MKKTLTLPLALATGLYASAQTIVQSGLTFEPATLTVDAGQEITITLNAPHTATEVSEETWDANENTPNGGFDFSAGTHTLTLDEPGVYYYVCTPHASMGMKGRIIVMPGSGVADRSTAPTLRVFPNPTSHELQVTGAIAGQIFTLTDAQGRVALRHTITGTDRVNIAALAAGNYNATLSDATNNVMAREQITIVR